MLALGRLDRDSQRQNVKSFDCLSRQTPVQSRTSGMTGDQLVVMSRTDVASSAIADDGVLSKLGLLCAEHRSFSDQYAV